MKFRLAIIIAALLAIQPLALRGADSAKAWGVDFKNMTYPNTSCGNGPAKMVDGRFHYSEQTSVTETDATIQQVTSGQLDGAKLAVIIFQCAPPKGCYNEARVYAVRDGKPVQIGGKLASLYDGCPDPVEWLHIRFTPKYLYADVRNQGDNWVVTTYRFSGSKLLKVFTQRHKLHVPTQ